MAEYLDHLFPENKEVNTIKVHCSSIASVLRMINPPTTIQEDTIHNIIRRMSILRPQTQEILLKGLMKPPFAFNRSDKDISLELLSYKTAFLVALATGARGSELVALFRAAHNLDFTTLESGSKHDSIRLVPKFIPRNQCPDLIPKPLKFPWHRSLVSPSARKTPMSCSGIRPLPGSIYGMGERRSTRETLRALLTGYPTVYHSLQALGGGNHPPYLRKLFRIWSSQGQSRWCSKGVGGFHSLLQEHSLIWAVWPNRMKVLKRFCPPLPQRHMWRPTLNCRTSL